MSYKPLLEDLTALGDELAELGDDALLGAVKAGARNSAADAQLIQEIAEAAGDILDLAVELGADDPNGEGEEEEGDEAAGGALALSDTELKSLLDDPLSYAQHECQDIAQACAALQAMAMLTASELSEGHAEDEEGTVAKLSTGMRTLTDFIRIEIDAIEGAGGHGEAKTLFVNGLVQGTGSIAIKGTVSGPLTVTNVSTGDWKSYAWSGTEWNVVAMADSVAAQEQVVSETATRAGESLKAQQATNEGYAVKMTGDDEVFGPAIWLNGSPDSHDLSRERDFFTKSTDFWLDHWDRRPMLWHHALNEDDILIEMRRSGASTDEVKAMREAFVHLHENPVIGVWTKATADPIAVWLHGQLNKAHRYRGAIKELVSRGLIKISTDSAPHLVIREARPNNTHEVKRWPIVAGSLTVSAAEPRLFDVQAVKAWYDEAGIPMPGEVAEQALPDERQRALLLEIGLLELETV